MPSDPENKLISRLREVKNSREVPSQAAEAWIQDESELKDTFSAEELARRAQATDPLVGKVIFGTYKIEKLLGEGAMGIVYKAKQLAFDRHVAMKTIKAEDPEISKRFAQEIKVHAQLKHDNIVEAIDCLIAPSGQVFFVMEYLEGVELEEFVKSKELSDKPLLLADIITQVLDALEYAHERGIVHRDLKPGNVVLVDKEGKATVKVVDFGIAKLQEDIQRLTKTGQALGSPVYMSPEQCMGEPVDGRSDIYSVGILIYELLTGELPFLGKDMVETMSFHCDPDKFPKLIEEHLPDLACAKQLDQILNKAMAAFPQNRFQNCKEFKKALQFLVKSLEQNTPSQNIPGTSRRVGKGTAIQRNKQRSEPELKQETEARKELAPAREVKPPAKKIKQPGMPAKKKSAVSSLMPALVAGLLVGLVLVVFILITALFFMKERVEDLRYRQPESRTSSPSVEQREPDSKKSAPAAEKQAVPEKPATKSEAVPKPISKRQVPAKRPVTRKSKPKPRTRPKSQPKPKPKAKKPSGPKSGTPFDELVKMKK